MQAENSIPVSENHPQSREALTLMFVEEQRLRALNFALDQVLGIPDSRLQISEGGEPLPAPANRCPQCREPNRYGDLCGVCARAMDAQFYEGERCRECGNTPATGACHFCKAD